MCLRTTFDVDTVVVNFWLVGSFVAGWARLAQVHFEHDIDFVALELRRMIGLFCLGQPYPKLLVFGLLSTDEHLAFAHRNLDRQKY